MSDEVPPHEEWLAERLAAKQEEPRGTGSLHSDLVSAESEIEQASRPERDAFDVRLPGKGDEPVLEIRAQRHRCGSPVERYFRAHQV